jgi:hypothetical protein
VKATIGAEAAQRSAPKVGAELAKLIAVFSIKMGNFG